MIYRVSSSHLNPWEFQDACVAAVYWVTGWRSIVGSEKPACAVEIPHTFRMYMTIMHHHNESNDLSFFVYVFSV